LPKLLRNDRHDYSRLSGRTGRTDGKKIRCFSFGELHGIGKRTGSKQRKKTGVKKCFAEWNGSRTTGYSCFRKRNAIWKPGGIQRRPE